MIPERFKQAAQAEYFCNAHTFIGLGEGREVSPRDVCGIKMRWLSVDEWFGQLDMIGQLRVMKYLREQHERASGHI